MLLRKGTCWYWQHGTVNRDVSDRLGGVCGGEKTGRKKNDQSGPGPQSWARVVGPTGPTFAGKFYNCTGTTMASGGRIKRIARRVDDWVTETAAPAKRRDLIVPSPVPLPGDDEDDEERQRTDSNESGSDASGRSSPEYGTGGLNDTVTISDDEEPRENVERSIEDEEEEEAEFSEEEQQSQDSDDAEFEQGAGGYPGFKDKMKQKSTKASPSSASNASTGSTRRLRWTFLSAVDLRQSKVDYEAQIEKVMRTQMMLAGPVKMATSYDDDMIKGCQTLAGWKRHRVCIFLFISCLISSNLFLCGPERFFETPE